MKDTAMEDQQLAARLRRLPKVELHLHLDGAVRPQTLLALAAAEGRALPAAEPEALRRYMQVEPGCSSLPEYLRTFDLVLPSMQRGAALERIACETVLDCAADGVRHVEIRFAPQLHRRQGLSVRQAAAHVLAGMRRGEAASKTTASAIAICMRHHETAVNLEVIEEAAPLLGHGLAAVDLAGDETAYPASRFREVFAAARRHRLPVTIHAGEAAGVHNIREAIEHLGASRIGHGVRLREDPALLELVRARGIALEMCPLSNMQTGAAASWDRYPLRTYWQQGLRVSVNTDNPTVSGTTLSAEYARLVRQGGLPISAVPELARNAIDAAFLSTARRAALHEELEQALLDWD
ncbi:adenosine deaminase [Paenibacillus sp. IB182496]|uniref:adenosine deaminase n=1 Tax=Paenibacillus sabuli TaxID=2772509 RepID=A0A927GT32_9BACL|nr:adenosine deaminase [Paenibacillus sabuli]MBD2846916.1 adenosine deaminase [Paenibacillus sabuli]